MKIVYLYQDEKTTERALDKLKRCFPLLDVHPVVFLHSESPRYIKSTRDFTIVPKNQIGQFIKNFDYTGVDYIVCSFMTDDKVRFILSAPKNIKIGWTIPGGDLYNRYLRYHGYELIYDERNRSIIQTVLYAIKCIVRRIEFRILIPRLSFVGCCDCDYKLIKEYSKSKKIPNQVYSFAYPIDKIMGTLYGIPFKNGNRIIIGNSASKTNNHLYVLDHIREIDVSNYTITIPFSYGDSDNAYKNKVCNAFFSYSQKIEILKDFISLKEYNKILVEGAIFIFGNWRQEAVGNILVAFYLGAKVYLSNKNPLFEEFRSKGFKLFELEQIYSSIFETFSFEDKCNNRNMCDKLYNYELGIKLYRDGYSKYYLD